ncbi:cellulase family glycosylhydrolase [Haloglycomyces albus]|uniref:cellulase family glycosylhydrolase n=1 Tax=Haloglycomyces albus TaxID=526067 RepID=UPI00046CCB87|nr:cellulase family glycosylhydrolase [Haloglycomyces albus]
MTTNDGASRYLTDEFGRSLILHGFNTAASAKRANGLPELTEEDVEREYADMGTNFVRYLLQWQAVEPEPGVIDEDYLAAVAERVEWYADRGYHVMLDMHQDLYSPYTNSTRVAGNGAPEWATHPDGLPVNTDLEQWELYYLEPGVIRSFDNFWATTSGDDGLMDHYADAWGSVADYFADTEAVIAYDIMNEPWGGTLQATEFETGPLAELYRRSIDTIRESDEDSWIFVEPQAVGVNWGMSTSLPRFDDPREGRARIGYAPHLYPLPLDLGSNYSDSTAAIDSALETWTDNTLRTAQRLDAPVILGEFGLDATAPGALDYVESVVDITDDTGMGWAYWSSDPGSWGPYDEEGSAQPLSDTLDRAYPRAVAGTPSTVDYDPDGRLSLDYDRDASIEAPTEFYLPENFAEGGEVTCSASCSVEWNDDRRIMSVWQSGDGPATITITA